MRSLACCRRRAKDFSLDFEERDRVVTYNGLETCILNSCSYDNETVGYKMGGADGCLTTVSPDDDASSCSSSKDALGSSFSSQCMLSNKQDEEHLLDEWDNLNSLHNLCIKGKSPVVHNMSAGDVDTMKEKFAKLLLGDDTSGGTKGVSTAFALSNAIINLSASVFGELWKLEPLSEERKNRWHREMNWFLSPTNFMVELVPAKQNGGNGRIFEIMTPKARPDVHMTLPALQKLDSMLIEVLDSMVDTEFWYEEGGSKAEGLDQINSRPIKKWWLPSPRVPESGLSDTQRKRLGFHGKFVHQILKAVKSINEQALLQMPIPSAVRDALSTKSAKASLGEHMYRAIITDFFPLEEILLSLNLKSEHSVLDTVNRLEGAIFAWQQRISVEANKKMAARYPWHFVKESRSENEKIMVYLGRSEALLRILKTKFQNLPQTFIDVTKVKYNKDVGHSIIEAYSRVLVGLSFSILSRIGDILQEDDLKKPTTPITNLKFDLSSDVYLAGITETPPCHIKRSLIDQMNMVDGRYSNCTKGKGAEDDLFDADGKAITMVMASPLRSSRAWCYGREARLFA